MRADRPMLRFVGLRDRPELLFLSVTGRLRVRFRRSAVGVRRFPILRAILPTERRTAKVLLVLIWDLASRRVPTVRV